MFKNFGAKLKKKRSTSRSRFLSIVTKKVTVFWMSVIDFKRSGNLNLHAVFVAELAVILWSGWQPCDGCLIRLDHNLQAFVQNPPVGNGHCFDHTMTLFFCFTFVLCNHIDQSSTCIYHYCWRTCRLKVIFMSA